MKRYIFTAIIVMLIEHIGLFSLIAPDFSIFTKDWFLFELTTAVVAFIIIGPIVAFEKDWSQQ